MPRQLKHWGCDFKCGQTYSKRSKIVSHEETCFRNPASKSCIICGAFCPSTEMECDTGYFERNFCEILDVALEADGKPKLRTNCESWIPKK